MYLLHENEEVASVYIYIYIYEMYVCNYASTWNIIIFTMLSHNLLLDLCVMSFCANFTAVCFDIAEFVCFLFFVFVVFLFF